MAISKFVASVVWFKPTSAGSEWDARVDQWEEVAESRPFQRLAGEVLTLARPTPADRVVDLGCGTGLLSLQLAPLVKRVVAVDSSGAMLERLTEKARAEATQNVEVVAADLRSLPLPDECATLVVSNYAFHHLDDIAKELALSEARRVLKPGGRLVICDMMFGLSLRARDVSVIRQKIVLMARRGPSGVLRIVRNGVRIATRRWEHPAPATRWEQMLAARGFDTLDVRLLEHEAGIVVAQRPPQSATTDGGTPGG